MRTALALVAVAAALTGCATNLAPVRDFADETKKISVAFEPILDRAVEQCRQKFIDRRVYTSDVAAKKFDAKKTIADADETCKAIQDENGTARQISGVLADFADQLAAAAADGLPSQLDGSYDALAGKLAEFKDVPAEKVGAINGLFKFLTRAVVARAQRQTIEEALSHEDAVATLADALVVYTDRVYGAYVRERRSDSASINEALQAASNNVATTRLQLMDVYRRDQQLQEQYKTVATMRTSVEQMKATMKDVRANLDRLSDGQRAAEIKKLSREVRALYQQLAKAF
jgi:DNA repair exonuclease SbcCD ATPase subunit